MCVLMIGLPFVFHWYCISTKVKCVLQQPMCMFQINDLQNSISAYPSTTEMFYCLSQLKNEFLPFPAQQNRVFAHHRRNKTVLPIPAEQICIVAHLSQIREFLPTSAQQKIVLPISAKQNRDFCPSPPNKTVFIVYPSPTKHMFHHLEHSNKSHVQQEVIVRGSWRSWEEEKSHSSLLIFNDIVILIDCCFEKYNPLTQIRDWN